MLNDVSRETSAKLHRFCGAVIEEADRQNLIARSTTADIWERHVADSAQLVALGGIGLWADVGSGAGFPGIVTALLTGQPHLLIEPRRRRAEFLQQQVEELDLGDRVQVFCGKAERARATAAVITARAVAPLHALFAAAHHLSRAETIWILPKGRSAALEVETAKARWHFDFDLIVSRTDANSLVVRASGVRPQS